MARISTGCPAIERARRLSVVLTERVTAGMLTGYDIVSLGRQPHTDWIGRLSAHDHAVVRSAIAAVDASDLARRQLAVLSDGERQRIMVARAIAQQPHVMVLDEITAFLDLPRRVEIMHLLADLAHRLETYSGLHARPRAGAAHGGSRVALRRPWSLALWRARRLGPGGRIRACVFRR
jgi:ABC-type cobalamin/Fe3+-siderophores transport system ATPase subunit